MALADEIRRVKEKIESTERDRARLEDRIKSQEDSEECDELGSLGQTLSELYQQELTLQKREVFVVRLGVLPLWCCFVLGIIESVAELFSADSPRDFYSHPSRFFGSPFVLMAYFDLIFVRCAFYWKKCFELTRCR